MVGGTEFGGLGPEGLSPEMANQLKEVFGSMFAGFFGGGERGYTEIQKELTPEGVIHKTRIFANLMEYMYWKHNIQPNNYRRNNFPAVRQLFFQFALCPLYAFRRSAQN